MFLLRPGVAFSSVIVSLYVYKLTWHCFIFLFRFCCFRCCFCLCLRCFNTTKFKIQIIHLHSLRNRIATAPLKHKSLKPKSCLWAFKHQTQPFQRMKLTNHILQQFAIAKVFKDNVNISLFSRFSLTLNIFFSINSIYFLFLKIKHRLRKSMRWTFTTPASFWWHRVTTNRFIYTIVSLESKYSNSSFVL